MPIALYEFLPPSLGLIMAALMLFCVLLVFIKNEIDTGIPFFDHMLTLFSRHGLINLDVKVDGEVVAIVGQLQFFTQKIGYL